MLRLRPKDPLHHPWQQLQLLKNGGLVVRARSGGGLYVIHMSGRWLRDVGTVARHRRLELPPLLHLLLPLTLPDLDADLDFDPDFDFDLDFVLVWIWVCDLMLIWDWMLINV